MAKHRAAERGVKSSHALAIGVMSAGLMGASAGPAVAAELSAPAIPQISIDIPELPQLHTGKDIKVPAKAQKAAQKASTELSAPAKKLNKTVRPHVDSMRKNAQPQAEKIRKDLDPLVEELQPVKKAVQPMLDKAFQDETVATVVGTVISIEDLVNPNAKQNKPTRAEIQRARGAKILKAARTRIGDPYVWGATGPNAFDCSGLVMWAHNQLGIEIPRTSQDQINGGRHIARKDLQPGDIIAFYGNASHVGVYAGKNRVVHAPYAGQSVTEASLDSMPYYGATRYY